MEVPEFLFCEVKILDTKANNSKTQTTKHLPPTPTKQVAEPAPTKVSKLYQVREQQGEKPLKISHVT
ncbi:hypothetical protein STEG23_036129 [Scotinomys teguina]